MNVRYTHLKDGNHVGLSVISIKAIPLSESIHEDPQTAVRNNASIFSEMLSTISLRAVNQNTVVELFCSSLPTEGQVYAAQVKMFLVLRRYGANESTIRENLRQMSASCTSSLQAASYIIDNSEEAYPEYETCVNHMCEDKAFSIEKQIRDGQIPGQGGRICYVSPFQNDEEYNNLSRVYEALSRFPYTSISMQLIPTEYTSKEKEFIHTVNYWIDAHSQFNRTAVQDNEATGYYRNLRDICDKRQFLFNIICFGNDESASTVAARIRASQQGIQGKTVITLADRIDHMPKYKETKAMFPWNFTMLKTQKSGVGIDPPEIFKRMAYITDESEVNAFFRLPVDDGQIVGVQTNRVGMTRETLERKHDSENGIIIGNMTGTDGREVPYYTNINQFTRHALIVGMPGTGKTTFSVNLLLQFYKHGIPFLAIEPTKAEYRAMIDAIQDLQIFTPGKNDVIPFIINPFIPQEGIPLEVFKPSLISAFKAAFSMPSPLDILFMKAIDNCYIEHGWRNYNKLNDPDTKLFSLQDFIQTFRRMIAESGYSAEVKGNMESGGTFRLLNLIVQNGNIYDNENSVPLDDLLSKPTVIELNAIDNQEQKALLMALLLINIVLYTKHHQAGDGKIKKVMLIDEAHVLLDPVGANSASKDGRAEAGASTVKALQNMIVEIRSYGTGIIIADQSPSKVTKEIVGNTDIKVVFQLVESEDKKIIASSCNMQEKDEDQLSRLRTGEAYTFSRGLDTPIRIQTEDIRAKENIRLVVSDEEIHNRMHFWDTRKELLIPFHQCKACKVCRECDFRIRDDAKFYVEKYYRQTRNSLKDNLHLSSAVLKIPVFIKEEEKGAESRRISRLVYCTAVLFIRKIALEKDINLSDTETQKVLRKVISRVEA